jgi:hypothetical protein
VAITEGETAVALLFVTIGDVFALAVKFVLTLVPAL